MKKQVKSRRRTAIEIKRFLETFKHGDLTTKEFCEINDIHQATFYKWRSRYAEVIPVEKSSFLVLDQVSFAAASEATLFAEVKGIKLYQAVEAGYLKELLS